MLIGTLRDENLKVDGSSRPNPNPKRKRRDRFRETGQWYGLDRWEETKLRWERTSSVVGKTKIEKGFEESGQDSIMGNEGVMAE